MLEQLKLLTNKLVAIPSVSGDSTSINLVLEAAAQELAAFPYKHFSSNAIPSLLFYNTPTMPKKFEVLLNAHLDVVPGNKEQFHIQETNGRMYGRGTYDMKGGAAAAILAFKAIASKVHYPLGLQLVTDEEVGGYDGTKYQIEQGIKTNFVIAGDSSNFTIVHKAKTLFWIKVTAKGITEHAGYPWLGDNAITKMVTFAKQVTDVFPTLQKDIWANTVTLSKIKTTNQAINKIPADCTAIFDIRCIPEEREIVLDKFKLLVPSDFSFQILLDEPAELTPKDSPYLQLLGKTATDVSGERPPLATKHGLSDVRFFMEMGAHGAQFGPKGGGHHSDEEWVDCKSLEQYYEILTTFLLSLDKHH